MDKTAATFIDEKCRGHFLKFIENLLNEKDLPPLPDADYNHMKDELCERLNKYLNVNILDELSKRSREDFQKYAQLIEKGTSPGELQKFIETKLPDITLVVSRILLEFRRVYLGLT